MDGSRSVSSSDWLVATPFYLTNKCVCAGPFPLSAGAVGSGLAIRPSLHRLMRHPSIHHRHRHSLSNERSKPTTWRHIVIMIEISRGIKFEITASRYGCCWRAAFRQTDVKKSWPKLTGGRDTNIYKQLFQYNDVFSPNRYIICLKSGV